MKVTTIYMPDSLRVLREPIAFHKYSMIKTLLVICYITLGEVNEIAQPSILAFPAPSLSLTARNTTRVHSLEANAPATSGNLLSFSTRPRSLPNQLLQHLHQKREGNGDPCKKGKTYNSCHSLVVTDPTTTQPVHSLSLGELTGTRVFCVLWS